MAQNSCLFTMLAGKNEGHQNVDLKKINISINKLYVKYIAIAREQITSKVQLATCSLKAISQWNAHKMRKLYQFYISHALLFFSLFFSLAPSLSFTLFLTISQTLSSSGTMSISLYLSFNLTLPFASFLLFTLLLILSTCRSHSCLLISLTDGQTNGRTDRQTG